MNEANRAPCMHAAHDVDYTYAAQDALQQLQHDLQQTTQKTAQAAQDSQSGQHFFQRLGEAVELSVQAFAHTLEDVIDFAAGGGGRCQGLRHLIHYSDNIGREAGDNFLQLR